MEYIFYDTSGLIEKAKSKNLFDDRIVISSITLQELEEMKYDSSKEAYLREAAANLLEVLGDSIDKYEVVIYKEDMSSSIIKKDLEINNNTKTIACAYWYDNHLHPDEVIYTTNNLANFNIANLFFGTDSIDYIKTK